MDAEQTKSPLLVTDLQINLCICQHAFKFLPDTVSDKNSWDTLTKRCFFPFSCSPRPSQSCLSRFGHQILYTNIEGTRRPQSVPTILTETVVYTPTNTIKLLVHDEMVKSFLVLLIGSKASDGGWVPNSFCKTTWYLLSKVGLVAKASKSINSFFRIFARSLADTRASMGRLGEVNRVLGNGGVMVGKSPDSLSWN